MASPQFHTLTIAAVRQLTSDSVALSFSVPDDLKDTYRFDPGQYLTLRATIDGEDIRRSYSICSHHREDLEVGIKHVTQGVFSGYAQQLKPGDTMQVMTPQGRFTAKIGGQHRYLLLATGSGITPCLSIAKSVLADEPGSHVTLAYGNRTTSSIMFRTDLHDLKDKYTGRFSMMHVMSGERQDAACFNGRLSGQKIKALQQQGLLDANQYDGIYLCGPHAMIEEVQGVLGELGVPEGVIHTELFTPAGGAVPTSVAAPAVAVTASVGASVTIIMDGAERSLQVDGASETVLAAAQRAGFDLPFSCAGGMCATCRCKVVQGDTSMDMNFSLAQWEIEAGFTLACQTRPQSDAITLDFDAF